jgi:RNA polymerase sigma-70 factor (ECF subfamily)
MEDKRIFQLLWQRAEAAIEAMTKQYGPRLYRTAMNILGRHEDAEEAVNDTYLAVWDAIPPETPDPLSGYIYKTGRNLALKRLRYDTAQRRCSDYDLSLEELEGCIGSANLQDEIDARMLGRAIDRFLDTQSKDSRVIFLRRYWFGDSVKEIARAMVMTEGAVSVRLNRVRNALKHYLNKEGYFL